MGDGAEVPKHPRIKATGKLSHKEMARIFRAGDLFIYLPWQEWCPKVVSQALVAGLPVVCSYRGGTKELVQDCGIVVSGAKDDDLEDFGPNPVNLDEAVKAVSSILEKADRCRTQPDANLSEIPKDISFLGWRCRERPDLYLSTMVRQYFEAFEKVLAQR